MRVLSVTTAIVMATIVVGAAQQKAKARPNAPPAASDPCKSPSAQSDYTNCSLEELSKADADLAKVYNALLKDLDDDHRPVLENAQKAWETFRRAECELQASDSLGGSMYAQEANDCMSAMAAERAETLKKVRKDLADFIR